MTGRKDALGGEPLQRVLPGVDAVDGPTGELDGLPQPPERPRWIERLDDWLGVQLAKDPPRVVLWWERVVIDKTPVWAQPLVIMAPMVALGVLVVFTPRLKDWIR